MFKVRVIKGCFVGHIKERGLRERETEEENEIFSSYAAHQQRAVFRAAGVSFGRKSAWIRV